MKHIGISLLVIFASFSAYAVEDLITHGSHGGGTHGGGSLNHPAGQHPAVHPNTMHPNAHPNAVTPGERRAIHRDVNNASWNNGGYGGGYILPTPTGDPLQDPNDDIDQIYKQNQQNMMRTKQ